MTIDLSMMVPDVSETTKLLEQFLTPETAKIVLGLQVHPEMVGFLCGLRLTHISHFSSQPLEL